MSDEKNVIAVFTSLWKSLRNAVPSSANAQLYNKERGWNYKQIEVGFAGKHITQALSKWDKELLLQLGLLRKYNQNLNTSPLKECIVFPLKDRDGNISGFYGRKLQNEMDKHVFIQEENGVYPEFPKPGTDKLILTTSISDTASLLQLDFIGSEYSVMAVHGFEGVKSIHREAIISIQDLKQVLIASPDGIKQEELKETIELIRPEVRIDVVDLPVGEDIASLFHKQKETLRLMFQFPEELKKESQTKEQEPQRQQELISPKGEFLSENPSELIYKTANAAYRVLGGIPDNMASMKVTLAIHHGVQEFKFYRNRIELFSFDEVQKEAIKAGGRIGVANSIIESELNYLSDLLEKYRKERGKSKNKIQVKPQVSESTIAEAKAFFSQKGLFQAIDKLIQEVGVVGEESKRLLVFAIATSYKMANPLHAIIIGGSSSGKTTLMNTIAEFIPHEDHVSFSRITEGSLFNLDEYELDKKLITIEDRKGLEDKAEYALRELQSKREIRSLVTAKNEAGEYGTQFKTVKASLASLSCTTSSDLLIDNENRCFMILVDQSQRQTERIIEYQNQLFAGKIDTRKQKELKSFLQSCVRILNPYPVINPYAGKITLPEKVRNKRRLNQLFLSLVNQITIIHQYQREKDSQGRLIVSLEDLEIATDILTDAIIMKADPLDDGLVRDFYERLKSHLNKKELTTRDIIEVMTMGKTNTCYYLNKLVESEYLIRSGSLNRGFKYQLSHNVNQDFDQLEKQIRMHLKSQIQVLKENF